MRRGPVRADRALEGATLTCATAVLVALLFVVGSVVVRGAPALSLRFVFGSPAGDPAEGGLLPVIVGTFACTMLMTLVCVPFGVATAVWLTELAARGRIVTLVRASIRNLAAVPSVVFGLFGLGFFVQFVGVQMDRALGLDVTWGQPALIWASLTLALLNLPVVIVTTEEALRAVPREMREASLALGATRWQTIRNVLLPQAMPGILTGAILSVSRGAGEVAPILFTGAAYFLPYLPTSPTDQFMELGYHVFVLATQSPDVDATKPLLYGTVLVLLLLTLLLNLTAMLLRARLRANLAGRS